MREGDVHNMLLCHQPNCSLNLRGREKNNRRQHHAIAARSSVSALSIGRYNAGTSGDSDGLTSGILPAGLCWADRRSEVLGREKERSFVWCLYCRVLQWETKSYWVQGLRESR